MTGAGREAVRIRSTLVLVAPAAVLATLLLVRGLFVGPTLDGAVFALIGDAVRRGEMPYRDLWDHKPPGIYLVNAMAGVALPILGAWARAWLVSWLSTILTMLGLSYLLRRWGVPGPGIRLALLLALPMVAAYHFALGGGQTESTGLVFAVVGLGLAVDGRLRAGFAAGISIAIAAAISPQFLPVAMAALAVANRRPRRLRAVVAGGAGMTAVAVAIIGWLAIGGALPAAYDSIIEYNRAYLAVNQELRAQALQTAALDGIYLLPLIVVALARVVSFRKHPLTDLDLAAVVWITTWLIFVVVQGVFFDHYATAVAPALVILAAPALGALIESIGEFRRASLARAGLLTVLLVPPIVGIGLTEGSAHAADSLPPTVTAVQRLTASDEPIFVWGNEADAYIDADRPAAGRFVYMFPLTMRGYATAGRIDVVLSDWLTRPPRVIVDATVNPGRVGGYPLTGSSGGPDRPDATLDPLRDFILSRYQLEESVGTWAIYTPRNLADR